MLPKLQAFILEILRWRPVTPLGMFLSRIEAGHGPNTCLYTRLCTPCDGGYHLGMCSCSSSRSIRGGFNDYNATEG